MPSSSPSSKKKGCIALITAIGVAFGTIVMCLYLGKNDDEQQQQQQQQSQNSLRKLPFAPVARPKHAGGYVERFYRYDDDDDWWGGGGNDDYSFNKDDDWSYKDDDWYDDWYDESPASGRPHHGGHFSNGKYREEPYQYVYQPVPNEYVVAIDGGIGGRYERSIESIRFNKITPITDGYDASTNAWRYEPSRDYIKGVHASIFPLMPGDYPVRGDKAIVLQRETMADCVVVNGDFQLYGDTAADYYSLLKPPRYPSSDPTHLFWEELRHVIQAQIARRNNQSPRTLNRWPDLWASKSLEDIAEAVKGEYPASHQQENIAHLFQEGIEMNHEMFPFRSVVDFVGTEPRISAMNTWALEEVGAVTFLLKWHTGVPRPEEIVWLIANGEFSQDDGVPSDVVDIVRSMKLTHAADFTAYLDGSPMHPSWPAMHSAGSSCSFWLPLIAKVTPEQYCETLRVDYAVAYARTIAGVHYKQDNYAGLNLGQHILKERLPFHLAKKYGSDPAKVRAKLEQLSFDWETFNPNDCTIDSVPVSERLVY